MRVLTLVVLLTALAACGKQPEVPKPGEPQSRAETEAIRNTEAVGYAGDAIANKVDSALDANDQRKAQLDAAMDAQSNPR
ncbi:MAG: hypothetical protein V4709_04785 [Pseudomonadota bacterium]